MLQKILSASVPLASLSAAERIGMVKKVLLLKSEPPAVLLCLVATIVFSQQGPKK